MSGHWPDGPVFFCGRLRHLWPWMQVDTYVHAHKFTPHPGQRLDCWLLFLSHTAVCHDGARQDRSGWSGLGWSLLIQPGHKGQPRSPEMGFFDQICVSQAEAHSLVVLDNMWQDSETTGIWLLCSCYYDMSSIFRSHIWVGVTFVTQSLLAFPAMPCKCPQKWPCEVISVTRACNTYLHVCSWRFQFWVMLGWCWG